MKRGAEEEEQAAGKVMAGERSATVGARTEKILLFLLVGVCLAEGALCLLEYRGSPFYQFPIIDEEVYVAWAEAILKGEPWGKGSFYQDPLYPYFLAVIFALGGKNFTAVRLIQIGMNTVAAALVWWMGRRVFGRGPGLAAAGLFVFCGSVYFYSLLLLKETLTLLLSAGTCAAGIWVADNPRRPLRSLLLGMAFGLLCLLRGNFLLVLPLAVLWSGFAAASGGRRFHLFPAAVVLAGAAMVLVPVTVRNYLSAGEFVLTTTQAGSNFYIGNNELADGRYAHLPFVRPNPRYQGEDFRRAAEERTGQRMSAAESSRYWFRESWRWMRQHPGRAARLWLTKARLVIHQHEVPDNQNFYLLRDEFVPALRWPLLGFGFLSGPALVAMAVSFRRRASRFLTLFALSYAAALIPFFVVGRYRFPLLPACAVLAGYFLVWCREKIVAQEYKPLAAGVAGAAVVAMAGLLPLPEGEGVKGYSYFLTGNAYLKAGEPARALLWLDRARDKLPNEAEVWAAWVSAIKAMPAEEVGLLEAEADKPDLGPQELNAIARRLEQLERPEAALVIYERILEQEPNFVPAHLRLAALYAGAAGKRDISRAEKHLERTLHLRPDYVEQPEYVELLNTLGEACFLAGDTVSARRWWEKARAAAPEFRAAEENLRRLERPAER